MFELKKLSRRAREFSRNVAIVAKDADVVQDCARSLWCVQYAKVRVSPVAHVVPHFPWTPLVCERKLEGLKVMRGGCCG